MGMEKTKNVARETKGKKEEEGEEEKSEEFTEVMGEEMNQ
jgi:hypothetical protein